MIAYWCKRLMVVFGWLPFRCESCERLTRTRRYCYCPTCGCPHGLVRPRRRVDRLVKKPVCSTPYMLPTETLPESIFASPFTQLSQMKLPSLDLLQPSEPRPDVLMQEGLQRSADTFRAAIDEKFLAGIQEASKRNAAFQGFADSLTDERKDGAK